MSNLIWSNLNNDWHDNSNPNKAEITTRHTVQLNNTQISAKQNKQKNDKCPNQVTSASSGFSLGMKREMELAESTHNSKKHVVIQNSKEQIDSMLESQPNKSNQKLSVSNSSGLTPVSDITMSSSLTQCSDNWEKMQLNLKMEEKQNQKRILTYVKDHLFKDLKFIPSPEMMIYSNKENSLNHYVCTALNIRMEEQWHYWSKYAGCVEKAVNAARNNALSAVKRSFLKGNSRLYCQYEDNAILTFY